MVTDFVNFGSLCSLKCDVIIYLQMFLTCGEYIDRLILCEISVPYRHDFIAIVFLLLPIIIWFHIIK